MATSGTDMISLLKDLISLGHSMEWLKNKGFSEQDIAHIQKEQQEQKEKIEAELQQREAKLRSQREEEAKAQLESRLRLEIEEKVRKEMETKFKKEMEAKRESEAKSGESKARSEALAPRVGWLKGIKLSARHFGGTSESPPISPEVPSKSRGFSGESRQRGGHRASETTIMQFLIEKSLFKKYATHMTLICELFMKDNADQFESFDDLFAQQQYTPYFMTVEILLEILNRDEIVYTFVSEQEKETNLNKSALQNMLKLVNFFTAAKIDQVIDALNRELKVSSNASSMRVTPISSPSESPVMLSLSGGSTGAPVSPMPPLSSAAFAGVDPKEASEAGSAREGSVREGKESRDTKESPRSFDDTVIVDHTCCFRRLLDVILDENLTCPEPENIKPLLEAMTSKTKKQRRRRTAGT